MKRILITGSNGFIGKHLQKRLLKDGHEIIGLPRHLLYDPESLKVFIKEKNPSQIYHLAAYGNKYDQKDEDLIMRANVLGTFNLLRATKDADIKAFINIGSSSEYGEKKKPMNEEDNLEPTTLYGVTKAMVTSLASFFGRTYGMPIVTVRPFSVYGSEDDQHHFIPTAIRCFKNGEELNLSPGLHDWIYIDDFIEGMITVAENATKLAGKVVNIGTGVQFTNNEVVELISKILGIPGNIKRVGKLRNYDTMVSWVADNALLKSLGWTQKINLEEGVERLIKNED